MISFVVHGKPAPQGSKRHVGHGIMIEASKRTRPWRALVTDAALQAYAGKPPMDGAVCLSIVFWFLPPKRSRRHGSPITRGTGDLSKLVRAIEDSLVDAHVMLDDSQIVSMQVSKRYCDMRVPDEVAFTPSAHITVFTHVPGTP